MSNHVDHFYFVQFFVNPVSPCVSVSLLVLVGGGDGAGVTGFGEKINDDYYECLTPATMKELLDACKKGKEPDMGRWGSLPLNGQVSCEGERETGYQVLYLYVIGVKSAERIAMDSVVCSYFSVASCLAHVWFLIVCSLWGSLLES